MCLAFGMRLLSDLLSLTSLTSMMSKRVTNEKIQPQPLILLEVVKAIAEKTMDTKNILRKLLKHDKVPLDIWKKLKQFSETNDKEYIQLYKAMKRVSK